MSVVVNEEGTFAYTQDGGVWRTNAMDGQGSLLKAPKTQLPTNPVQKIDGATDIAQWGDDNLFPQNVVREAEANTILPGLLEYKAKAWYGGGLVYGKIAGYDDQGNELFQRLRLPEVEAFFKRSRINRYAYESLLDISWFAMSFPEYVITKDRKQIVGLTSQEACYCRFSLPDPATGFSKHVHINANWDNGGKSGDGHDTRVPVLDPYFDTVEQIRANTGDYKFIHPLAMPSPNKSLYQLASWNSVRRSGWLDVAAAIPHFKKALFKNQLSIKYVVEVHHAYWAWKYGEWQSKEAPERKKIISDELDEFNKIMTGTDGAGRSILTTTLKHPATGEDVAAFKVTAIDDKLKSGLYVEDSQEAASHVYTAVGVAPTLRGVSPGKQMGAGSGSDARVAFNNFISTSKFEQDLVLEPLEVVRDYNGWDPEIVFRFQNPLIMTLDKGKQTQQETA